MENGKLPAFSSVQLFEHGAELKECLGLTKREYFAGLAMQGAFNSHSFSNAGIEYVAKWSTQMADELLKQLEKTK